MDLDDLIAALIIGAGLLAVLVETHAPHGAQRSAGEPALPSLPPASFDAFRDFISAT